MERLAHELQDVKKKFVVSHSPRVLSLSLSLSLSNMYLKLFLTCDVSLLLTVRYFDMKRQTTKGQTVALPVCFSQALFPFATILLSPPDSTVHPRTHTAARWHDAPAALCRRRLQCFGICQGALEHLLAAHTRRLRTHTSL